MRRQSPLRNDVARERLAHGRVSGGGVEDRDSVVAEVPRPRPERGDVEQPRAPDEAAEPFVVGEEEPPVADDGAAEGASELVPLRLGDVPSRRRIRLELREGIPRLELVALEELEGAAVELVRSGTGQDRDHPRDRLPELGVVVLGGDLGLADRLQRGVDHDDAEDRVAVVGAVELVPGSAEVLAVHHGLDGALRVLGGCVLPGLLLGSRREQHEPREVPLEHREIRDLPGLEARGHVGAVGLQELAARGAHRDRLR